MRGSGMGMGFAKTDLARDADGNARLARARREDLAHVRPGQRAPGEVVRDDEEVDQRDGGDAGGGDGAVLGWVGFDDGGGGDLARGHEERAEGQDAAAVDGVGHEEDEGQAGGDFDRAEDGGQQEGGVVAVADEELEVLGAEVGEAEFGVSISAVLWAGLRWYSYAVAPVACWAVKTAAAVTVRFQLCLSTISEQSQTNILSSMKVA